VSGRFQSNGAALVHYLAQPFVDTLSKALIHSAFVA